MILQPSKEGIFFMPRKEKIMLNKLTTKIIILIGIMAAISAVLQQLEIPMIGFLSLEFSDLPSVLMAGLYGPIPGVLVELVKNIIKLLTTKTGFIGELANFIIGSAFVIPIGIAFNKMRRNVEFSFKKIILTFLIATVVMTVVGAVANYFVLIPFYANFLGGVDNVVNMITKLIPIVKTKLDLILFYITPFNIFKGVLLSVISIIIVYFRLLKGKK